MLARAEVSLLDVFYGRHHNGDFVGFGTGWCDGVVVEVVVVDDCGEFLY